MKHRAHQLIRVLIYTCIRNIIDREFVTSAKKIANFNEFSEIKKFVKKFVKCLSGRGLPTTTEEFDAFHSFMLIKI